MKQSIPSIHIRKDTSAATSGSRQNNLSFANSVFHLFGEKGQPSCSGEKEKVILQACEQFLEYNKRSPYR